MTQPGTIGTPNRPTRVTTEELYLGTGSPYNTDVGSLLGVTFDVAQTQDGTLVFDGVQGPFDGEVSIWVDGSQHPVTAVEYVDGGGVRRPVTRWHLGEFGEFLLTLDSLAFIQPAAFDVSITGTNGPVAPGNTLDVTVDVSNSGGESATQTVTLDIDNSVGQVDSTSVTVSGGGSTTQTLSWAVPSGQTKQDYQATVASADDTESQTVTVSSGVPASLVSHWTFDDADTNSGTAVDTVGSNDGTVQGATTGISGANQTYTTNEAYSFDGTDDYVNVPHTSAFNIGQYSIAGWFKTSSSASQGLFSKYSGGKGYYLGANLNSGCILYNRGDNGDLDYITTDSSFTDGNWHHLVGTRSGSGASGLELYVDGAAVSTSVGSNSGSDTSTHNFDVNIGRREASSWPMDGDIDDVRFYDKTLTSTEVSNLYNNGRI